MSSQPFTLRWGILATGNIATRFATDLLIDPSTRNVPNIRHVIAAVASSTCLSRAETFLHDLGIPNAKAYGSYADLVTATDTDIDIVYIATPHSHHYANVRLCLEAGKHVLVEKPATVNAAQWRVLTRLARQKKLFLMEAVWTRFFPLARQVGGFLRSGRLGDVRRVWADFGCWKDVEGEYGGNGEDRMVNMRLAGGVLLDLGVYSLTWVFMALFDGHGHGHGHSHGDDDDGEKEQANGKKSSSSSSTLSPKVACVMTKFEQTGCDEQTSVLLAFPSGAHGIATTSIRVAHDAAAEEKGDESWPVRIQGTLGDLLVGPTLYAPTRYRLVPAESEERGRLAGFGLETVEHEIPGGGFGMFWEADECARCVKEGRVESEGMSWRETEEVMRVMDECRRQGGLDYGEELEGVEYIAE